MNLTCVRYPPPSPSLLIWTSQEMGWLYFGVKRARPKQTKIVRELEIKPPLGAGSRGHVTKSLEPGQRLIVRNTLSIRSPYSRCRLSCHENKTRKFTMCDQYQNHYYQLVCRSGNISPILNRYTDRNHIIETIRRASNPQVQYLISTMNMS